MAGKPIVKLHEKYEGFERILWDLRESLCEKRHTNAKKRWGAGGVLRSTIYNVTNSGA
ncbi:hypothetical protein AGMMS49983_21770 [Clostridia bacterium]|nr:hypothetical protein AGMMS49983_21770 [Clostridia bacterium]